MPRPRQLRNTYIQAALRTGMCFSARTTILVPYLDIAMFNDLFLFFSDIKKMRVACVLLLVVSMAVASESRQVHDKADSKVIIYRNVASI